MSVLPLGVNEVEIKRQLTSSSTAVFMPFTTEELFMSSNTSLYYGLNSLSHNLIMADRKKLKNPNGLILGTPGSGKSFAAKREMANAILVTDDDVIISASPEFLLKPVCKRLKIKNLMASKVDMHSGKYSGVNCHGKEKVKRFYEAFPNGKIDNFYSDSYSDSPLAEIAEKAFMVDGDKVEGWIFFK